jgi:predicted acylesterase/phospholipase RssA
VVYPPTEIGNVAYWDGGTVANTPLGPAVDAGAEDIIVVLMTPWEDELDRPRYTPVGGLKGLFAAIQAAFEWALLASFQADLKLFNRTNDMVRLTLQNYRLQVENAALRAQLQDAEETSPSSALNIDDILFREVPPPVIVSPQQPISVLDIIRYEPDNHVRLYQMGYEDAKAAWARAGRPVEGQ